MSYLPGRRDTGCVAVEQKRNHHCGVIGRLTPLIGTITIFDLRKIEGMDYIRDEISEVVTGQPLPKRWRQ